MTPTTFPCPFCGRKMGVGPDLLGKQVRCPHCKQVIVAPAPAPPVAVAVPVPPPVAVAVPPPPPPVVAPPAPAPGLPSELPVFNLPSQENQDSIFGEAVEEGDEVFGSNPDPLPVPELPPALVPPPPPVTVPTPVFHAPAPAQAYPAPVPVAADPFAGFNAAPAYTPPAPVPVVAVPPPPPVAAFAYPTATTASANPWAGFDQAPTPAAPPQATFAVPPPVAAYVAPAPVAYTPPQAVVAVEPEPMPAAMVDDDQPPEPRRGSRDRRPERDDRRPRPERGRPVEKTAGAGAAGFIKIGFFLMIPYAFLMTVLAIYGLFIREGGKLPDGHPLSLIPDTRGEYPPAERKKTGKLGIKIDDPLPPDLRAGLGKKITVGHIEVEPVAVAVRKLKIEKVLAKGGEPVSKSTPEAVVLKLSVKNTSSDLSFHPLDPAFNRLEFPTDTPPTALTIGKSTFAGGAVKWPYESGVKRAYESAQEDDDKPLGPGETRTYVVTSNAKADVVRAVQNAKEPIVWRVQLRRGLVEFRGREVPVTTLVGVEFKASDVKNSDE